MNEAKREKARKLKPSKSLMVMHNRFSLPFLNCPFFSINAVRMTTWRKFHCRVSFLSHSCVVYRYSWEQNGYNKYKQSTTRPFYSLLSRVTKCNVLQFSVLCRAATRENGIHSQNYPKKNIHMPCPSSSVQTQCRKETSIIFNSRKTSSDKLAFFLFLTDTFFARYLHLLILLRARIKKDGKKVRKRSRGRLLKLLEEVVSSLQYMVNFSNKTFPWWWWSYKQNYVERNGVYIFPNFFYCYKIIYSEILCGHKYIAMWDTGGFRMRFLSIYILRVCKFHTWTICIFSRYTSFLKMYTQEAHYSQKLFGYMLHIGQQNSLFFPSSLRLFKLPCNAKNVPCVNGIQFIWLI